MMQASEIDMGLSSLSQFEMELIVIDVSEERKLVGGLHGMYYKRIPTFDQFKSFIKEIQSKQI